MEQKEFDIRSEEVQDILSFVPNWMIRWGSTLFAAIFILLLGFTWFIKYPDTIIGAFVLSSSNPPIEVISRLDGKIKTIYFQEGDDVKQGDKIIAIENILESSDVLFLNEFIASVKSNLTHEKYELRINNSKNSLGEIQRDYNELLNKLKDYNLMNDNQYYKQEENALLNKVEQNKRLVLSTKKKTEISKESLEIAKEKFQINQQLYQSKVLSKMEFLDKKDDFNNSKKIFEDINGLLIERSINLSTLQNQHENLLFDRKEKKRKLREGIENNIRVIENNIAIWTQENILKAPSNGILSFPKPLFSNMSVDSNEPLFAVIPQSEDYQGYVSVDQKGMGKIKVGDKVFIRFHNYPHQEFGQVIGVIDYIPNIAFNNSFNLSVTLTEGLTTTYHKGIIYTPKMLGEAEIITKDIRLVDRFMYHIYSSFKD